MAELERNLDAPAPAAVLVVDDSSTARAVARRALGAAGFEVLEAAGGTEALAALRGRRFDAVLLDWNMPGIGGLELLGHLRDLPHHTDTAVLMVTSELDPRREVYAVAAGADGYLHKPYTSEQLAAAVAAAIDARRTS